MLANFRSWLKAHGWAYRFKKKEILLKRWSQCPTAGMEHLLLCVSPARCMYCIFECKYGLLSFTERNIITVGTKIHLKWAGEEEVGNLKCQGFGKAYSHSFLLAFVQVFFGDWVFSLAVWLFSATQCLNRQQETKSLTINCIKISSAESIEESNLSCTKNYLLLTRV